VGSDQYENEGPENDVYARGEQAERLEEPQQGASRQNPKSDEQSEVYVVLHSSSKMVLDDIGGFASLRRIGWIPRSLGKRRPIGVVPTKNRLKPKGFGLARVMIERTAEINTLLTARSEWD